MFNEGWSKTLLDTGPPGPSLDSPDLKTVFCIYLHYLCVRLILVLSESFKCDKYANKQIIIKKPEGGKHLFTALYMNHKFGFYKWIF